LRFGQKNLEKKSPNKPTGTKANALLCPSCCIEYIEVEFDFEVEGIILQNVKALRCPSCSEEVFTPEQSDAIIYRINQTKSL
jgi:hypothetical protein